MTAALGVLVLAATVAGTDARAALPSLIARTRGGAVLEVPAAHVASGARARIVEFRGAPVAARGVRSAAASTSYRDTFERFHRDLAAVAAKRGSRAMAMAVEHEYFRTFHGVSATLDDAEADAVRRFSYVKAVHEDLPVKAFGEDTTRIERIRANRVWSELKTRGEGIRVAVIDTGVDYNHPALAGKVVPGYDFIGGDGDPMDEHGHGTHVAGIIIGDVEDVRGVAPGAQVVAFRALDASGQGSSSDVIAAVERAVDPNGDGDLSDGVDIINLSLGSDYGDADDPASLALDAAVNAGVVVCVAAGNLGGSQSIGAPAASRRAITVGNADEHDLMDVVSSVGPSYPDFSQKPEVVAPGTLIRSAKLGGGTMLAIGTSMAAPHVAGAAALLLALHPDWTPDDVKAALIGSVEPMFDDVMQQGAGRIDAYAAAVLRTTAAPAYVEFGRTPGLGDWSATRVVRITNRGTAAQSYVAKVTVPDDVTVEVEPAALTLEAGASRDVTITGHIGRFAVGSELSMSLGGRVEFQSATETLRVPWVAVDAAYTRVSYDGPNPSRVWACDGPAYFYGRSNGPVLETLLPFVGCDLLVSSFGQEHGEARVIVRQVEVEGDFEMQLSTADAKHQVRLAGVDAAGRPIAERATSPGAVYFAHYNLEFPHLLFPAISVTTYSTEPLYVSLLNPDVTIATDEMLFELPQGRIVTIHHPQTRGVSGDVTLTTAPSDLRRAKVEVAPQAGAALDGLAMLAGQDGSLFSTSTGRPIALDHGWKGEVFVNAGTDASDALASGLAIIRPPDPAWVTTTPAFRAIDGRVVLSNDRIPAPGAYSVQDGGTMRIGRRPLVPHTLLDVDGTAFSLLFGFSGPAGESYLAPAKNVSFAVRDGSGTLLEEGTTAHRVARDYQKRGPYRIDLTVPYAQVSVAFDTTREDYNPPLLNALRLQDGEVRLAVGDWQRGGGGLISDSGNVQSAKLWYRAAGSAWQEVPLTRLLEDRGPQEQLGHFATGVHFGGTMPPLTGNVELRVEMQDRAGNSSVITLEDVLNAGMRRRAVGR